MSLVQNGRIDRRAAHVGPRDFSPLPVGKVLPSPSHFVPALLDAPRALPNYEAMDDVADYAQTLPRRTQPQAVERQEPSHV